MIEKTTDNNKMTERAATGSAGKRRGHQHHPKNIGIRTSNVPTSEILLALREGRNLETLFQHNNNNQQADNKQTQLTNQNHIHSTTDTGTVTRLNETSDVIAKKNVLKDLDNSNNNVGLKTSSKRNPTTPSEKLEKSSRKSKNPDGKKKRVKTDISKIFRPAADGAPSDYISEEDDAETAELAKLRCTSERTEVIAEREHRRQKRCADYPGLAFGRSIFSSDSMMKFNIIRNELQNIMNNQLRRVRIVVLVVNDGHT